MTKINVHAAQLVVEQGNPAALVARELVETISETVYKFINGPGIHIVPIPASIKFRMLIFC
jgi:hypothetical protein